MTGDEVVGLLDEIIDNKLPKKELHETLSWRCKEVATKDREAFIYALDKWIDRKQEPYALLAVNLAVEMRLGELRGSIEGLLKAVNQGAAFRPQLKDYYSTRLQEALISL